MGTKRSKLSVKNIIFRIANIILVTGLGIFLVYYLLSKIDISDLKSGSIDIEDLEELGFDKKKLVLLVSFVLVSEDKFLTRFHNSCHVLDFREVVQHGDADRVRNNRIIDYVIRINPLESNTVQVICILVEIIVGKLVHQVYCDEEKTGNPHREPNNVNECKKLSLPQISDRNQDIVLKHRSSPLIVIRNYTMFRFKRIWKIHDIL